MELIDIIAEKRDAIKETCAKYGATAVRVFGSCARQENDEKSDIDILVELQTSKTGWQYTGLLDDIAEELQGLLGRKVDVWTAEMLKPKVREKALKEAVSL
jgi:uncharacterized protein